MKASKNQRVDRIYFHYEELEEYKAGMWVRHTGETRKEFVGCAARLMRQPEKFMDAMRSVLDLWPKSCLHNLTSLDSNRIAWLGHAGCCVSTGSTEECTRVAWHTLTNDEQDEANRVAAEVLEIWDEDHKAIPCLSNQLELTF